VTHRLGSGSAPTEATAALPVITGRTAPNAIWHTAGLWRPVAAVLSVTALALVVAALVARPTPDFGERPVIAVLRDAGGQSLWSIRLASSSHEIAVDSVAAPSPPPGHVYQLWLVSKAGPPHPLGLLPQSGRKVIPETPANTRLLSASGKLLVTLEPNGGSDDPGPSGPVKFGGRFAGSG
jgi:anti-sigma-K factor RskA